MAKLLWLSALAGMSCAHVQVQEQNPRAAELAKSLDELLGRKFPADQPGIAVLIKKGQHVVFSRGYGLADLKTREPITPATLFNLGSITKTFVAGAILILAEEKKLAVEDDLSKYFPGFKKKEIAARVKIAHLLTHTSGLPDNREVAKNREFYLTAKDAENWYPLTQADALLFDPGSRFEYSNPAFNGLALIVEQVSGMRWQGFVEERIFKPAGMSKSTITDGRHPISGVAHAYQREGDRWVEDDYGEEPTFAAAGNGGVWSSVEELARYEQALRSGVFLSPASVTAARTIKTFDGWSGTEPPVVGWSWFIEQPAGQPRRIGHTGSQGGFIADYVTLPDKDLMFVFLGNTPCDRDALDQRIMQELEAARWLE